VKKLSNKDEKSLIARIGFCSVKRFTDLDKVNLVIFELGGLVLGLSQVSQLFQLLQKKITLTSKVVKSDSK